MCCEDEHYSLLFEELASYDPCKHVESNSLIMIKYKLGICALIGWNYANGFTGDVIILCDRTDTGHRTPVIGQWTTNGGQLCRISLSICSTESKPDPASMSQSMIRLICHQRIGKKESCK